MKTFIYFLIALFLTAIGSACRYNSTETAKSPVSTIPLNVSKRSKKQVATTPAEKYGELKVDSVLPASLHRIPIKIVNHTDSRMETGDEYWLEYYNDSLSTWQDALPPNLAYTLLLHIIPPHDTVDLTVYEFTGKPGKYRAIKEVTLLYEFNNQSYNYLVIGEFILSGETDRKGKNE